MPTPNFYFVASLVLHPVILVFLSNSICPSICISPETSTVPISIGNCPSGGRYGDSLENNSSFFFVSWSACFSILLACFILFNEFSPSLLNKVSTSFSFCFSLFTVAFSFMIMYQSFHFLTQCYIKCPFRWPFCHHFFSSLLLFVLRSCLLGNGYFNPNICTRVAAIPFPIIL